MAQDYLNLTGTGNDAATASAWTATPTTPTTPSTLPPKPETTAPTGGGYTTQGPNDGLAGALTGTSTGSTNGQQSWGSFLQSLGYAGLGRDPYAGQEVSQIESDGQMVNNILDPDYWLRTMTHTDTRLNNKFSDQQALLGYLQGGGQVSELGKIENQRQNMQQDLARLQAAAANNPNRANSLQNFMSRMQRDTAQLNSQEQQIRSMLPNLAGFETQANPAGTGKFNGKDGVNMQSLKQFQRFTDPNYVQGQQSLISGMGQLGDLFASNPDLANNSALAAFLAKMMN